MPPRSLLRPLALGWVPIFALAVAAAAPDTHGQQRHDQQRIDPQQLLQDLSTLAHDSMEGRRAGSPGGERARRFLLEAFPERGLAPLGGTRTHTFQFTPRGGEEGIEAEGVNVLGVVEGTRYPDRYIVLTAHYDHLGVQDGEIFNGADDNASGTAALLAIGAYLAGNPLDHSVLFVAFDAEEHGLTGARAFVDDAPVAHESIVMNVNMDMISRSQVGELYAAGTYHYPFLTPLVQEVARGNQIAVIRGHDRPDLPPGDDWTMSSDHGPFHLAGIPFIYFGVEDHLGYHNPTDTMENITPAFYVRAVETVLDFILLADAAGQEILRITATRSNPR